jgi:hypothetical protein
MKTSIRKVGPRRAMQNAAYYFLRKRKKLKGNERFGGWRMNRLGALELIGKDEALQGLKG